ncbi:hypothetical protein BOTCAL_0572g00020 [Botryotinia calthae]|uniref:Methyltransferase domain-containing protein n=1 Tax=Botryotinia calthae TaxID=38488 RepID=A0A4Y8CJG0_9HELO|nr:hypothetical protein BOTCAL_0572g00020 [Botryotinia calthae]
MVESTLNLSQIEKELSKNALIKDAIIIEQDDNTIKAFITLKPLVDPKAENRQVKLWRTMFDKGMYATIKNKPGSTIGRDFTGWVCQYNSIPIDIAEMNEWLDDTIHQILTTHGEDHSLDVLELGTGSGMILFNLIPNLRCYHGLDPSPNVIDFVAATARSIPSLEGKLHLYQGTALDFHLLKEATPTLAIINSVAQYFPSSNYLLNVIQGLLDLNTLSTIFFGDMRSFALEPEFCISKALSQFGETISKEDLRKELGQPHSEFLVDPAFFTSLVERLPERIASVEILPKHMKASNELVQYRYSAVIHVKNSHSQEPMIQPQDWIDFSQQNLNRESLCSLLSTTFEDVVAISNIPYSKTIFEREVLSSLQISDEKPDWLSNVRVNSQKIPSLSALDLDLIAEETGFEVKSSCARQFSQKGGLDAIFCRNSALGKQFRFPVDHVERKWEWFANEPLKGKKIQVKAGGNPPQAVLDVLKTQGLEGRCDVVILEELPVKEGMVDREVLEKMR